MFAFAHVYTNTETKRISQQIMTSALTYFTYLPTIYIPNIQYRCQSVLLNWQNSHNHHHTATTATTLSSLYGKYLIEHYTNCVLGAMKAHASALCPCTHIFQLCRHII